MRFRRPKRFFGRDFTPEELEIIRQVIEDCRGLSRHELASTVCELLEWKRPTGKLKVMECREVLEKLEKAKLFELPATRGAPPGTWKVSIPEEGFELRQVELQGNADAFGPYRVEPLRTKEERLLWRHLIGTHHYLGYKVPYGASLRYLAYADGDAPIACMLFSSPAWRIMCRDEWIGWEDRAREENLQQIVNNSRFLILPWVRVKNLASKLLSLVVRRVGRDWEDLYNVRPVLLESMVDVAIFSGTCYRAANWKYLGMTTGRGRNDENRVGNTVQPKAVFVYPLVQDFRKKLGASAVIAAPRPGFPAGGRPRTNRLLKEKAGMLPGRKATRRGKASEGTPSP